LPKAIEPSELFCEDSPTFSENHLPNDRQVVMPEKTRKRDRETKLDDLMRHEPKSSRGLKRVKYAHCSNEINTDDIKTPNPRVLPEYQALLDKLMGHDTVRNNLSNEIQHVMWKFEVQQQFDSYVSLVREINRVFA
jgi:hypothetical protein